MIYKYFLKINLIQGNPSVYPLFETSCSSISAFKPGTECMKTWSIKHHTVLRVLICVHTGSNLWQHIESHSASSSNYGWKLLVTRVTWVQEVTLRWAIDKTSIERAVYQWLAYDGPPVNTLDGYPGNQSLVASNQTSASKWYLVGTAVVWSSNSWISGFPLSAHAPQVWKILSDSALTHCKDLCISSRHKSNKEELLIL